MENLEALNRYAEVRSWLLNEDYETAKARVEQIAEESGADYLEEEERERETVSR